jgi:putative membrane protein
MSNKFLHNSSALCALVIATAALAQTPPQPADPPTSSGSATDRSSMHADASSRKPLTARSFASEVAVINKAEIELGEMALKNSKDAAVQKFAQRMITDHTGADKQLKGIAAKQNLDLPRQLDAEHQALKDKLSTLKGDEFDREYAKAMAKGHDKAVKLFEQASRDTLLPSELKQFAATTLPTLKEHADMAHSLKGGESHSSSDQRRS